MEPLLEFWHTWRGLFAILALLSVVLVRYASSKFLTPPLDADPVIREKPATVADSGTLATPSTQQRAQGAVKKVPKRITGSRTFSRKRTSPIQAGTTTSKKIQPLIFYSTLTGSTERFAKDLEGIVNDQISLKSDNQVLPSKVLDLSDVELDDYFTATPKALHVQYFYMVLIPSYDIDTNLNNFVDHLKESHYDFRVDTAPLSSLAGYSVFGFGDRQGWPTEDEGFCYQAREVDKWLAKLTGRKRAYPLGMGDTKGDVEARLSEWKDGVLAILSDLCNGGSLGDGVPGSGDAVESDDEDIDDEVQPTTSSTRQTTVQDLETLGGTTNHDATDPSNAPIAVDFTTYRSTPTNAPQPQPLKAMVPITSPTHAALTKQGYTIVGTHSGVKICRWTKSALRGRGSCYKFSFYGIKSHLCMETTPSLSCSNKCVFCWRHGTNPVGTTWRWQVDPPDMIFAGVKEGHYKKIKMMRGVPGVRAERFEEAMRIKHCALSLVGEPIFYPYINEFLGMLHGEGISSFLVCNAQHPKQLRDLDKVTQLYVSIDASDKETLRKIDKPLHRDFWERFNECLDVIKTKRDLQRTVYRLTLVKGFNVDAEAEGYARLVKQGLPCFVEVKGVTFCGTSTSKGAGLTMQNVPFYEEVCAFVVALEKALARSGLDYGIAAEHAHSCCILLADRRFYKRGKWHTQIDYGRFFELLQRRRETGEEFGPLDYTAPTPEWAFWGNGGFDPADARVDRKGRPKEAR